MPRYLGFFKYSAHGTEGFLKDKAAGREAATKQALESVGGKLVSMYWLVSGEYSGVGNLGIPRCCHRSGTAGIDFIDRSMMSALPPKDGVIGRRLVDS
jgi:hypothetical protein